MVRVQLSREGYSSVGRALTLPFSIFFLLYTYMSKFNASVKESKRATTNYMGGKSFTQSEKEEIAFAVLSSFIENSYYESKDKRITRIQGLVEKIAKEEPEYIAKLAVVARKEFHMRSSFHILTAELSRFHKGDSLVKNLIVQATERPDDLLEIVGYLKKPIPNAVKKGIAQALTKFNEYQLGKYKGENKDFKLVDLFNLVHPKAKNGESKTWKKLLSGKLEAPNTWEVRSSSGEDKQKMWGELIGNDELGYMALLRNLRNILKSADAATIKDALRKLTDRESVLKSKQLPFRFLSAYKALEETKESDLVFEKDATKTVDVTSALNKALSYSVENIPLLKGRTVILSDNSGSMRGDGGGSSLVSAYSKQTTADIANLFAVLYWTRTDNTIVGLFGDTLVIPNLDREADIFNNFTTIDKAANRVGPGTETGIFVMFEKLIKDKVMADRIVIFSDCQVGTGCQWYDSGSRRADDFGKLYRDYKAINPEVMVYSVDLKGLGNTLFADGVVQLSGWSDKIFDIMSMNEKHEGLVKYVEDYPIQLQ